MVEARREVEGRRGEVVGPRAEAEGLRVEAPRVEARRDEVGGSRVDLAWWWVLTPRWWGIARRRVTALSRGEHVLGVGIGGCCIGGGHERQDNDADHRKRRPKQLWAEDSFLGRPQKQRAAGVAASCGIVRDNRYV